MPLDGFEEFLETSNTHRAKKSEELKPTPATGEPNLQPQAVQQMLNQPLPTAQRQGLLRQIATRRGAGSVQRLVSQARRSASSGPGGGPLENDLSEKVQTARSGGQSLDNTVRREAEQSLGYDLSQVRVHTDSTAAELNEQMGAKAFTTGRDIFFSENEGPNNRELLLHEATHTIQQGMSEEPPTSIGAADTSHEQAAHQASTGSGPASLGVQREGDDDEEVQMLRDPAAVMREEEDEEQDN